MTRIFSFHAQHDSFVEVHHMKCFYWSCYPVNAKAVAYHLQYPSNKNNETNKWMNHKTEHCTKQTNSNKSSQSHLGIVRCYLHGRDWTCLLHGETHCRQIQSLSDGFATQLTYSPSKKKKEICPFPNWRYSCPKFPLEQQKNENCL